MHELGITQDILEIVAERAAGRGSRRVVLEIGKLSAVLPDAIRFCFDLCSEGTRRRGRRAGDPGAARAAPGAGRAGPTSCWTARSAAAGAARTDLEWLGGEELTIKGMELA